MWNEREEELVVEDEEDAKAISSVKFRVGDVVTVYTYGKPLGVLIRTMRPRVLVVTCL